MLSLETILKDTIWVGKFYSGERCKGTYDQIGEDQSEYRDFDLACAEGQPDHLKEFYEGYFNQRKYFGIQEYYHNVYKVDKTVLMYEVSYISNGVCQANIYIGESEVQVANHFKANRLDCELIGIRETTYAKPGQPIINLTRGGN